MQELATYKTEPVIGGFSELLQRQSEIHGVKQVDIVNTLGQSKGAVSQWFNDKAHPNPDNLPGLAALLKVPITVLTLAIAKTNFVSMIRSAVDTLNLELSVIAQGCNMTESELAAVLTGEYMPSYSKLETMTLCLSLPGKKLQYLKSIISNNVIDANQEQNHSDLSIIATDDSMFPSIIKGDTVTYEPIPIEQVPPGRKVVVKEIESGSYLVRTAYSAGDDIIFAPINRNTSPNAWVTLDLHSAIYIGVATKVTRAI